VPKIGRPRQAPGKARRELWSELQYPAADAFVAEIDVARHREQFLDVSVAQREAMIQPNGMADNGIVTLIALSSPLGVVFQR
jgi:hypothetical protein